MAKTKHTAGVEEAATEIFRYLVRQDDLLPTRHLPEKQIPAFAVIIEKHKTPAEKAAPTLQARIEELEASLDVRKRICRDVVAEKAELVEELKMCVRGWDTFQDLRALTVWERERLDSAQALLAKAKREA